MKIKDIGFAAQHIYNQYRAGIEMNIILSKMSKIQKRHSEFWGEVAYDVNDGKLLSEALEGHWPDSFLIAISAGENSGTVQKQDGSRVNALQVVFERIYRTCNLYEGVRSALLKLLYPLFVFISGILIFCLYMVVIIPKTSKMMQNSRYRLDPVMEKVLSCSDFLTDVIVTNPSKSILFLAFICLVVYVMLKSSGIKQFLSELIIKTPYVGTAVVSY